MRVVADVMIGGDDGTHVLRAFTRAIADEEEGCQRSVSGQHFEQGRRIRRRTVVEGQPHDPVAIRRQPAQDCAEQA